jgi:hypothetical protein
VAANAADADKAIKGKRIAAVRSAVFMSDFLLFR